MQAKRKRFSTALHSSIFFFQIEHNGNRDTNLKDGSNRDTKFKGREHDRTAGIRRMRIQFKSPFLLLDKIYLEAITKKKIPQILFILVFIIMIEHNVLPLKRIKLI